MGDNMGIYEKFAEYYDMLYGRKEYQKENDVIERILAKSCTRRPTNILDIGCGTGSHAIALSKRGFNVTGRFLFKDDRKSKEERCRTKKQGTLCCPRHAQNKAAQTI